MGGNFRYNVNKGWTKPGGTKEDFTDEETYCHAVGAGDADFIVANDFVLTEFAYNEYFFDLSEILTHEQMKIYQPYFLYYDKSVLDEINNIDYTAKTMPIISLPNPSRPDLMEEPIPVMIDITSSEKISVLYPNSNESYAMGFIANGKNNKKALNFLKYLLY